MKVSAIIASFGAHKWGHLARTRALPSVEGQGFHEVICRHEEGATLAQVRNACAEEATGDYLLYVDADDSLDAGFLRSITSSYMENGEPDNCLFTPAVQYVRGNTRKGTARIWPEVDIHDGNWMIIGTAVPRRTFLEVGGFREYGWSEDWATWALCMEAGSVPVKVPDAVYLAYISQNSRNRGKSRATMLHWHQAIGHDIWPHLYESPTEEEHAMKKLSTNHIRRIA